MTTSSIEERDIYVALAGAVYYRLPESGAIRISGETWRDFLQRQTTNDMALLTPERAVLTVLTSPMARIVDVFRLAQAGPDTVLAFSVPGRAAQTAAFLQSRIFFNDKVTVEDISAEVAQFDLDGAGLSALLAVLDVSPAQEPDGVIRVGSGDVQIILLPREGLAGQGYRLEVPAAQAAEIESKLGAAGGIALDTDAYEVLRVEAGLPGTGELTEDYTPLETNLAHGVSDSKGCYTGQEVIARQITYDKITRQLVTLRLAGPATIGDRVSAAGKTAGEVTSVVQSPRHGWLALAVVKKPHYEAGTQVVVGEGVAAAVATLPLTSES